MTARAAWKGPRRKPWLFITTCTPRKVALVKGEDAFKVCKALSDPEVPPVRSPAGGWVVSLGVAEDIRTYARHLGELVVVHELREPR
jgi:hypothetical protein